MAPLVEARSLSEVVALAANPPAELEIIGARRSQEPLVLYIARVPGSKGKLVYSFNSSLLNVREWG
jgi:hypothetical protein